jgi:hypothetical protein
MAMGIKFCDKFLVPFLIKYIITSKKLYKFHRTFAEGSKLHPSSFLCASIVLLNYNSKSENWDKTSWELLK